MTAFDCARRFRSCAAQSLWHLLQGLSPRSTILEPLLRVLLLPLCTTAWPMLCLRFMPRCSEAGGRQLSGHGRLGASGAGCPNPCCLALGCPSFGSLGLVGVSLLPQPCPAGSCAVLVVARVSWQLRASVPAGSTRCCPSQPGVQGRLPGRCKEASGLEMDHRVRGRSTLRIPRSSPRCSLVTNCFQSCLRYLSKHLAPLWGAQARTNGWLGQCALLRCHGKRRSTFRPQCGTPTLVASPTEKSGRLVHLGLVKSTRLTAAEWLLEACMWDELDVRELRARVRPAQAWSPVSLRPQSPGPNAELC